jgi:hypothetical protein
MKISFIALTLFISLATYSQDDVFSNQLQKIIISARNDFKEFFGSIERLSSPVYHSTMTLIGTTDNVIFASYIDSTGIYPAFYSAKIDSCDEKKAKKLIKEWAKKIKKNIKETFEEKEEEFDFPFGAGTTKTILLTAMNFKIKVYYEQLKRYSPPTNKRSRNELKSEFAEYYLVFLSIMKN